MQRFDDRGLPRAPSADSCHLSIETDFLQFPLVRFTGSRSDLAEKWQAMNSRSNAEVRVVPDGLCGFKNLIHSPSTSEAFTFWNWFHISR